ncbi:hypothetical protein VHEMI04993 [[Torrubiella] hemipterigena]|uniref:Uncharacterized protein n=1 Tax=[Torrubiella] hemipterigena TaxID=1531966 RepID=A0A0A1SWT3_9HYPO|nr:hypothetical protein VHEMI04993 [[Torrubiella] hemipterigena]
MSVRVQEALDEERRHVADDRQKLLSQITALINSQADTQDSRMAEKTKTIQTTIADANTSLENAMSQYGTGMDTWDEKEAQLLEDVKKSRETLKTKLKDDWTAASEQSTAIQNTARAVHGDTSRVVEEQVEEFGNQMQALDDFVTRARQENNAHHDTHAKSMQALSGTVDQSFVNISTHFKTTFDRVKNMGEEMAVDVKDMQDGLEPLDSQLCQPLTNLRDVVTATSLQEYQPTGDTPQKVPYQYPTTLPRTGSETSISRIDEEPPSPVSQGNEAPVDETMVFADLPTLRPKESSDSLTTSILDKSQLSMSLREVNPNVTSNLTTGAIGFDPRASTISTPAETTGPLFKRSSRLGLARGIKKQAVSEGRENVPLTSSYPTGTKRKSARLA